MTILRTLARLAADRNHWRQLSPAWRREQLRHEGTHGRAEGPAWEQAARTGDDDDHPTTEEE